MVVGVAGILEGALALLGGGGGAVGEGVEEGAHVVVF